MNNSAIVAGSVGLIGSAISGHLWSNEWRVIDMDIAVNDLDVSKRDSLLFALEKTKPDVFINASYPKNYNDHRAAYWIATEIVGEWMLHRGRGCIINFASIYGVVNPSPVLYMGTNVKEPQQWYCQVKRELIEVTRKWAIIFKPVRVNCISPGGIFDGQDPVFVERYCKRTLSGRMTTLDDIVKAVMFLIECEGITGQNVVIDGGFTL